MAERRTGKTTVLKKMLANTPAGFIGIYQDLEGISSPGEFVEAVGLKLRNRFNFMHRAFYEGDRFLNRFAGGQAQGIKLPEEKQKNWKSHLPGLIQKVTLKEDQRLLFFWDELPLMLYNIKAKSGPGVAMDVLDVIRNLRQDLNVRMVLTGSVGLHHVVDELRKGGYSNAPVNDLYQADVSPLSREYSLELARRLLQGENIPVDDLDAVAQEIAETSDDVPYYIHHLIVSLKSTNKLADQHAVQKVAQDSLSIASDPWNFRYYKVRIETYYSDEEAPVAYAILDALSHETGPMGLDELFNQVKSKYKIKDRELVKYVLRLLELDHYVSGSAETQFQFRSKLIKTWWRQQSA